PPAINWADWNHIVFQKSGETKQIWVNGEMLAEGTGAAPLLSDMTHLFIGNGGVTPASSTLGRTDDFGIIAGNLTPAQIQEIAQGGAPLPQIFDSSEPSLVAASRFDLGQIPAVPPTHSGSFLVRNYGETETLTLTGATLSGTHADHFTITTPFPIDVSPRSAVSIEVTFDSQGGQGLFAATAEFESNDANTEDPNVTQLFARIINLA